MGQFNSIAYDRVELYVIDTLKEKVTKKRIVSNGIICSSYKYLTELTKKQSTMLLNILCDARTYGNPPLSCSTQDIGVVFYKKDSIVKYVTISMDCDYIIPSHIIPADERKKNRYDDITIPSTFTIWGKKKLIAFFKSVGVNTSHYDVRDCDYLSKKK